MKLYNYFRSSASYRVRIALALKGLTYEHIAVNLLRAEHLEPAYAGSTADALVPMLMLDDGQALTQSMAIIEYLTKFPELPCFPRRPGACAGEGARTLRGMKSTRSTTFGC